MIEGSIRVDYLNSDGSVAGYQNGLIMSYHNQSVIFTPFKINSDHFTHLENAICIHNDIVIQMNESRFAYPFLIRIWNIKSLGINSASELTNNIPKKNHIINNTKIEKINDININIWHKNLPSIFAHEIETIVDIGSIVHYNNKVTGIVIEHLNNSSIIVNTYTLKQLINGQDYFYANLYYGLSINDKNNIYVKQDWDQYTNCLIKDDIILEIENTPVSMHMYFDKFNKHIYIDTWITCMYMEKENHELKFKILRNQKEQYINVPRIPIKDIMRIPFYSTTEEQESFEKINTLDRYSNIGRDLQMNPKKLFV
jgi:uncharacterized protein YkvS